MELDKEFALRYAELEQLQAQTKRLEFLFAKSHLARLRSAAAQVLLLANGVPMSSCSTSWKRGVDDPAVQAAAASLRVTPADFISNSNRVLRRGTTVRFGQLQRLEAEVADMASVITPHMQSEAGWECSILQGYASIKHVFKDNFKVGLQR